MKLKLKTFGHATLALYAEGDAPILLTDPWLVGSAYWRSWWLQRYPSAAELNWAARSTYVYITHEHPDHFHMPSIRRLGTGPTYLFPDLPEQGFLAYVAHQGYRAQVVSPRRWIAVHDKISILSLPAWNDDSVLLIDTPTALLVNFNDAKPFWPVLHAIRRLGRHLDKPLVVLCSYSPASLINSFMNAAGVTSLKSPRQYVEQVSRLCNAVGAHFYIPFASQAVFSREDSQWANDYRTTFDDLQRYWRASAKLLPPYVRLDLAQFTHSSDCAEDLAGENTRIAALARNRIEEERAGTLSPTDLTHLEGRLRTFRWILWAMFPRGFSLLLGDRLVKYESFHGRLTESEKAKSNPGDFVMAIPALPMKEALRNNHVSDLGIAMFVRIRTVRRMNPKKVFVLFILWAIADYGHLKCTGSLLRWISAGLRNTFFVRLPTPPADVDPPDLLRRDHAREMAR